MLQETGGQEKALGRRDDGPQQTGPSEWILVSTALHAANRIHSVIERSLFLCCVAAA